MRRAADPVVVDPAAAVLPEARAAVAVVVARVVADKVVVAVESPGAEADKVVAVAVVSPGAEAAKVVVAVVLIAAVVVADKVVVAKAAEVAEDVRPAAVAKAVVDKAAAVVVDVHPEAVGAAETVSSSHSSGASQCCGAPFFY